MSFCVNEVIKKIRRLKQKKDFLYICEFTKLTEILLKAVCGGPLYMAYL